MKSLIFVTCLTLIVAHESQFEEDDEIVLVEDVQEEPEPKYRYDDSAHHGSSSSSSSSSRSRGGSESGSSSSSKTTKTTDEVLLAAEKQMFKLSVKQKKWDVFEDGNTVASFAADLESGYPAFQYRHAGLVAQHAKDPEANKDQYEKAVEIQAEYDRLKGAVAEQVDRHQELMRSCLGIVGAKGVKGSKNLGKYINSRLKARKLDRRLSSKDNIKEMLKLQTAVRGSRLHGLGDDELFSLMAWSTLPALLLLLLRSTLIHYRIFDFPSLHVSTNVDIITTTFPAVTALVLTLYTAGPRFLTYPQMAVALFIAGFMSFLMLCLTTILLKAVRVNNRRRKLRKNSKH